MWPIMILDINRDPKAFAHSTPATTLGLFLQCAWRNDMAEPWILWMCGIGALGGLLIRLGWQLHVAGIL